MSKSVEQLFAEIRDMSPDEINAKIDDHQSQIRALRKLLLMIRETTTGETTIDRDKMS